MTIPRMLRANTPTPVDKLSRSLQVIPRIVRVRVYAVACHALVNVSRA